MHRSNVFPGVYYAGRIFCNRYWMHGWRDEERNGTTRFLEMRRVKYMAGSILTVLAGFWGCKEKYTPTITAANPNYLVVEGVINSGADSTIVKLSRTVSISGRSVVNPELNAIVSVESDQNVSYPVLPAGNGKYAAPPLSISSSGKYRLKILTSDGNEYLSDYETVIPNPPIDSINFTVGAKGINIYTNTHDPDNNTHYYRWDYKETWKFHAQYQSLFITTGDTLVLRRQDQQIYTCFANNTSSTIVLGSSAKLVRDVIYENPLTEIASTSEKLEARYSVLVSQYALNKNEYAFWQNLKKNTEQLGSIFDPQPSNLKGNIHCTTNPSEQVIGYIGVTNIQKKRIFIDNSQLPLQWRPTYPYECSLDTLLFCRGQNCENDVAELLIPIGSTFLPIAQAIPRNNPAVIGYLGASINCSDCTIRGSLKQPDFWK